MITINDSNMLHIQGLPPPYARAIKKKLSLDNPEYVRKIKLKTPLWNTPRWITYYKENEKTLSVPLGFKKQLLQFFEKHDLAYEITEEKTDMPFSDSIESTIVLRDYQVPIVEAMLAHDRGIVHLSTGGGKSIIALEYIARTNRSTMIIVKDKNILHQIEEECKKFLGFAPAIIGDGKKELGKIIIATIQTLHSDGELLAFVADTIDTLIIDECHTMISDIRRSVIQEFSPRRIFGLTATPYTSEESMQTPAVQYCFGEIIYSHEIEQMKPAVNVIATGMRVPVLADYHKMVEALIRHPKRNKLITGFILGEILSGSRCLVLSKRVEHAELLYNELSHLASVYWIKQDTKDRGEILHEMKNGKRPFSCIIGTTQLLGTGFDIPTLDRLFLVGDMKSNVLTVQTTGRILRLLNGKDPVIYDFVDEKNGMLLSQYRHRKKVYMQKEWNIEVHPAIMERYL